MAKQETAKQDLFGINDDNADGDEYIIVQLTPADGWRAVFSGEHGTIRTLGLACFALVEVIPENPEVAHIPQRAVRPMVVDEFGDVEDVASFEEFLCIVPPGADTQATVAFVAEKQREAAK